MKVFRDAPQLQRSKEGLDRFLDLKLVNCIKPDWASKYELPNFRNRPCSFISFYGTFLHWPIKPPKLYKAMLP